MAQSFIYNPGVGSTASVTKGFLDDVLTDYTPLSTLLFVESQLEAGIAAADGAVQYKGVWNALTNTPNLITATPEKGDYYIVSVSGTTNLSGITDWIVTDWAVFNGTVWQKADHSDVVVSVNAQTGAVTLTTTDINEGTNLYYTEARVSANTDVANATTHISSSSGVHGVVGSVVGDSDAQTLTNKTVSLTNNTLTGTLSEFNTALSGTDFLSTDQLQTVTNKLLIDNSVTFADVTDTTKRIEMDVANAVTGTSCNIKSVVSNNRTITLPDATTTLVGQDTTDTLTNKSISLTNNTLTGTLSEFNTALTGTDFLSTNQLQTVSQKILLDNSVTFADVTDTTKRIGLDVANTLTGTSCNIKSVVSDNRIITLPDATTTLVGQDTTDTLTNKSISSASNTLSINSTDVTYTGDTIDPNIVNVVDYLVTDDIRAPSVGTSVGISNVDGLGAILTTTEIQGSFITTKRTDYKHTAVGGRILYDDSIPNLQISGVNGSGIVLTTGPAGQTFYPNGDISLGGGNLFVASTGNVGVSPSNYFSQANLPGDDLHVHSSNTDACNILVTGQGSTTAGGRIQYNSSNLTFDIAALAGAGDLRFRSNNLVRMEIHQNGDTNIKNGCMFFQDSNNRIGISPSAWFSTGTNLPQANTHIHHNNSTTNNILITSSGSTTAGGLIYHDSAGEFGVGSNVGGGQLVLNTEGTARYEITTTGRLRRVGNSNNSATAFLQCYTDQSQIGVYFNSNNSTSQADIMQLKFAEIDNASVAGTNGFVNFNGRTGQIGSITGDGAGGVSYNLTSDQRLKQNIVDTAINGIDKISQVQIRDYEFISNPGKIITGMVAQELLAVLPCCVSGDPNSDPNERPMGVDYSKLVPLLVKTCQEQQALIVSLQNRVTALEAYHA